MEYEKVSIYNILIINDNYTIVSAGIDHNETPYGIVGKFMVKKVDIFTWAAVNAGGAYPEVELRWDGISPRWQEMICIAAIIGAEPLP